MKQSKVASTPPPPPPAPQTRGPRYRYFSTTPATVTLRMRDLQVPEKARAAGYDSEQFVDLPCVDIFGGPAPKILLTRLAELAPNSVTAKDLPNEGVKVCSARLALAYVVTEGREILAEEPAVLPEAAAGEDVAPSAAPAPTAGVASPTQPGPEMPEFLPPLPKPRAKLPDSSAKPADAPSAQPEPREASKPAPEFPLPAAGTQTPPPKAKVPAPFSEAVPPPKSEIAGPPPEPPPAASAPEPPKAPEPPAPSPIPTAKKPFSLFPMFRRKEASDNKPSVQVPRGRIEIPKPKRPLPPSSTAGEPEPETAPAPEPSAKELKPPGPKPSIPKPRFEPVRSFEPKPAPPPTPSERPKPAETPLSAAPAPEVPKAAEMPELPLLEPKDPPAAPEPVPSIGSSEKESAPQEKSKTQPVAPSAPAAELSSEPKLDAPPEPKNPAARIIPTPPLKVFTPTPQPSSPAPEPPGPAPDAPAAPSPRAAEEAPKNVPVAIEVPPPAAPAIPAVLVETEHVSRKDVPPEIAEQDSLQAIFHTEEQLSVDRVLELCGNLPGIHSCVLSHGSSVIAAHNTPDSVDIVSLSAHALEMLKAMRASSAKMGIGAVPAVTVHSEKGPITFFHQEDLCLLVLHKDRGFVPGVREKLQFVMDELSKAKLPLQIGDRPGKKLPG